MMDKKTARERGDLSPFQERVNIHLFFSGAQRRKTLEEVKNSIVDGVPIITITGEEGCGKTMICRMVEKELPSEYSCVFLPSTLESFDDVVRVLALGLGTENSKNPVSSHLLVTEILHYLSENDRRLVVIFDQSERMYLATIERIRKMLDRVNENDMLFQIVFAGRNTLLENLQQLAICNFKISEQKDFTLSALGLSETYAYLNHCVQQRSSVKGKSIFTPEAAKKIYNMAKGNFRMTNILAEKSLEAFDSETSFMVLLDNVSDEKSGPLTQQVKKAGLYTSFPGKKWLSGAALISIVLVYFLFFNGQEDTKIPPQTDPETNAVEKWDGGAATGGKIDKEVQSATTATTSSPEKKNIPESGSESIASTAPAADPANEKPAMDDAPQPEVTKKTEGSQPVTKKEGQVTHQEPVAPAKVEKSTTTASQVAIVPEVKDQPAQTPVDSAIRIAPPLVKSSREQGNAVVADAEKTPPGSEENAARISTTFSPGSTNAEISPTQPDNNEVITTEDSIKKGDNEVVVAAGNTSANGETLEKDDRETSVAGEVVSYEEVPNLQILADGKKNLPPSLTAETDAKKVVKIAPVSVKLTQSENETAGAAQESVLTPDQLFQQGAAAASRWLVGADNGKHTVQLMMLTSEQAEKNLKDRFVQQEYIDIADNLYIIKNQNASVFVFYGEYADADEARKARNTLPLFLRKDNPYAISVEEAVKKATAVQ